MGNAKTAAEILLDTLAARGADRAFCVPGESYIALLDALHADEFATVVCCTPPSPRAVPAEDTAAAARALGVDEVLVVPDVARACDEAIDSAGIDDAVLVTGSLYVAGAARHHLRNRLR